MANPIDIDPKEYVQTLEFLKQIDFLKGVPDDNLKSMLFTLQKQDFEAGKIILRQGEIGANLYIIRKGKVAITAKSGNNRLTLGELNPPQYFGEISLLTPTSATATVTAGEEGVQVLILTNESVIQLSKKFSDIQQRIRAVIDTRVAGKKQAREAEENAEN